jgi:hypothetical protein
MSDSVVSSVGIQRGVLDVVDVLDLLLRGLFGLVGRVKGRGVADHLADDLPPKEDAHDHQDDHVDGHARQKGGRFLEDPVAHLLAEGAVFFARFFVLGVLSVGLVGAHVSSP